MMIYTVAPCAATLYAQPANRHARSWLIQRAARPAVPGLLTPYAQPPGHLHAFAGWATMVSRRTSALRPIAQPHHGWRHRRHAQVCCLKHVDGWIHGDHFTTGDRPKVGILVYQYYNSIVLRRMLVVVHEYAMIIS